MSSTPKIIALLFLPLLGFAQLRAVTELGDTIYVYNDGTWSFSPEDSDVMNPDNLAFLTQRVKIDTSNISYYAPETANKEVKSSFGFFSIKYDDSQWKRVPPGEFNKEAEFAFKSIKKDIYCIVIAEEIEIGAENILKIAMQTMEENTGSKVENLKAELRKVNGTELLRCVNKVSLTGMSLVFDNYYYSDARGTVQFSTWTGSTLWKKYEKDIGDLLNGFIVLPQ